MTETTQDFLARPTVWLAAAGGLFMCVNFIRAWWRPVAFATYLGLPLADDKDQELVRIYALRALFIGLLVGVLIVTRNGQGLGLLALTAAVMPVGDAWLTAQQGAPKATVVRHLVILVILLAIAAGFLLGGGDLG